MESGKSKILLSVVSFLYLVSYIFIIFAIVLMDIFDQGVGEIAVVFNLFSFVLIFVHVIATSIMYGDEGVKKVEDSDEKQEEVEVTETAKPVSFTIVFLLNGVFIALGNVIIFATTF